MMANSPVASPPQPLDVLLVEDNPGDVRLIKELLQGLPYPGFTLTWRERLSEAHRYLDRKHPEVILMDLGLPDAYGLEAMEGIRELVNGVPVVVLTALDDQRIAHRALEIGAQDYLVKGCFDAQMLYRSIRYAIDRQRRDAALRASEARTRKLFEACLIGLVLTDSKGRILEANQAFLDLLEFGKEEVGSKGVRWDCRVLEVWQERHGDALMDIEAGRGHPAWEVEFQKKNGTPLPILLGAARLEGPDSGIVAYAMDISERKALLEQLQRESRQDALTRLMNRRGFLEILETTMLASKRYGHPMSLALCDLDNFKLVNDRYGHGAGDEVLRFFGEALAKEIRGDDISARLGGDEFCILFAHSPAALASKSLERVRSTFAGKAFVSPRGIPFSVTATFGLVDLPKGGGTPEGLLQLADDILYGAKEGGRNRIGFG